jgi:hypothetical protein
MIVTHLHHLLLDSKGCGCSTAPCNESNSSPTLVQYGCHIRLFKTCASAKLRKEVITLLLHWEYIYIVGSHKGDRQTEGHNVFEHGMRKVGTASD